ncbi:MULTISPECIES: hypothetical protein [Vibrio]|uniref:Uncharacterized protein n=2 Tax=Vibrio TaxID=662 RepID=A0A7X4LKS9_9VIBR|nr:MULTISPECIES: hypothetical protein [Vibrio]MBF9000370.1 hypothetical protein [Vibrio nitrifigilis]MZI93620.1 hypothetical protein [Vibrio eleionomae]
MGNLKNNTEQHNNALEQFLMQSEAYFSLSREEIDDLEDTTSSANLAFIRRDNAPVQSALNI